MAEPVKIGKIDTNISNELVYLWQYDKAKKLTSILKKDDNFAAVSVGEFLQNFITNILNINYSTTWALELWGEILGVIRPNYYDPDSQTYIPFKDDMYRKLLLGRVKKFNSNGSVKDINDYLQFIFPDKYIYAKNNNDMTMEIIMYAGIAAEDVAVLQSDGFIPVPVGVQVKYGVVDINETFGFYGSGFAPFDQGTFFNTNLA